MDLIRYIESQEYTQIVILSKFRRIGGIKIDDVATELGISKSLLSLLESGKREVSTEQIKRYSQYLQQKLGFKRNDLYQVLTRLSKDHRVTSVEAKENPLDFLFTYFKGFCN